VEIAERLLLRRVFRPLMAWALKDGPDAGAGDARGFYFGQNDRSNGLLYVHFLRSPGKNDTAGDTNINTNPVPCWISTQYGIKW
jgi:hypothetical protein